MISIAAGTFRGGQPGVLDGGLDGDAQTAAGNTVFARQGYRRGLCPNAERFYAEELSLPLFADLTDSDVDRVIDTLLKLVGYRD